MRNDQDELKISIALNTYVNWVRNEVKNQILKKG